MLRSYFHRLSSIRGGGCSVDPGPAVGAEGGRGGELSAALWAVLHSSLDPRRGRRPGHLSLRLRGYPGQVGVVVDGQEYREQRLVESREYAADDRACDAEGGTYRARDHRSYPDDYPEDEVGRERLEPPVADQLAASPHAAADPL